MNVWVFEDVTGDSINIPIPFVSAYVQRGRNISSRSTFPYDFVGDFAGTVIPSKPNTSSLDGVKYYDRITCSNNNCKANFSVYLTKEKFYCPVCRKPIKFNQLETAPSTRSV